jgi:hypothetical protein
MAEEARAAHDPPLLQRPHESKSHALRYCQDRWRVQALGVIAAHKRAAQNKKYFCANGKLVAGSQVSSTPSARTS